MVALSCGNYNQPDTLPFFQYSNTRFSYNSHNGAGWQIGCMSGQFTSSQTFYVNGLARIVGTVELKGALCNINAQHVYNHVNLPSEIKVHQTKASLEDPAGLAA